MSKYNSYFIDNDMWYKKRKDVYHLLGNEKDSNSSCIIATYSTTTKKLLIKGANEHIPEHSVLRSLVEYAESKGKEAEE